MSAHLRKAESANNFRFDLLTSVTVSIDIVWAAMSHILVKMCRSFGRNYCLHHQVILRSWMMTGPDKDSTIV
jgi:hypothetical protein